MFKPSLLYDNWYDVFLAFNSQPFLMSVLDSGGVWVEKFNVSSVSVLGKDFNNGLPSLSVYITSWVPSSMPGLFFFIFTSLKKTFFTELSAPRKLSPCFFSTERIKDERHGFSFSGKSFSACVVSKWLTFIFLPLISLSSTEEGSILKVASSFLSPSKSTPKYKTNSVVSGSDSS